MRLSPGLIVLVLAAPPAVPLHAAESVDYEAVAKIRDEAFHRSEVMDTLAQLTDSLGPRLTNSPQQRAASDWARTRLEGWGLKNARLESWGHFGRGWSCQGVSVRMVAPQVAQLIGYPKAWTPGTNGAVRGEVVKAVVKEEADLDKLKGQVAGKIVLLGDAAPLATSDKPVFSRYDAAGLEELSRFEAPSTDRARREEAVKRIALGKKVRAFMATEKALAVFEPSEREGAVVRVTGGGSREKDEDPGVPNLVLAVEHYNRLVRLAERKQKVEVEIDVKAAFNDDNEDAANVVAEIPGTDKAAEVVMVGAHLDSWHSGTGATDNAAGSAVAMEAVRIIQALGLKPRRTIRIALWTGEEQGLLGSRGYVKEHFASRPESSDPTEKDLPSGLRTPQWPITVKPEHAKFSAYFNLDNGTGKVRGIYAQENGAAVPVFEAWLKPLADLGATTITQRNTGSTDHVPFDAVGLPGFQFIQDPADYSTRSHHTNVDTMDRIQKDDMVQASIVMASFAYNAAMRDALFPRKPMPKEPAKTPEKAPEKPAAR